MEGQGEKHFVCCFLKFLNFLNFCDWSQKPKGTFSQSPVKMSQQPAMLPYAVNYLLPTYLSSLILTNSKSISGSYYFVILCATTKHFDRVDQIWQSHQLQITQSKSKHGTKCKTPQRKKSVHRHLLKEMRQNFFRVRKYYAEYYTQY